jgi:hypothetical protein
MSSVAFSVQKAVDALLSPILADVVPPSTGIAGVPLYDHVPDAAAYPYVQFARAIKTPTDALTDLIDDIQLSLAVYSTFRGQEEVLQILGAIEAALHRAALDLDLGYSIQCVLESSDTARDQDGVTYTGTANFRITVAH